MQRWGARITPPRTPSRSIARPLAIVTEISPCKVQVATSEREK